MGQYRAHLLLTVWPLALLWVWELSRLGFALQGSAAFAAATDAGWGDLLWVTLLIFAGAVSHAWGWRSLRAEPADVAGPYRSAGCRRLQRWAGGFAWALVFGHLAVRWWMHAQAGPEALSHYELWRNVLSLPLVVGAYLLGLGATALYVSQALAAFIRSFGLGSRPKASRWLEIGCALAAAGLLLASGNVLSHFATGRAWVGSKVVPIESQTQLEGSL